MSNTGTEADGSRPSTLAAAREQGYVPLRDLTGVADEVGPLWPAQCALWMDALGPRTGEDEYDEQVDRWMVQSPWPNLSVRQVLNALWRWLEQDRSYLDGDVREARIREFFTLRESDAAALTEPDDPT